MSARGRVTRRGGGRTHRSAPTRGGGGVWEPTGIGAKWHLSLRGGTEPAPYRGAEAFAVGCGHPALRVQRRWCQVTGRCRYRPLRPAGGREGGTPGSSCPTGGCGEPPRLPWPAAHSEASAPAGAKKWVGIGAGITPKRASNAGQSLSQPAADSSLCTREPLGTGGADCRVGPYGRSTEVPATGRCGHRPLRVVAESCRDHSGSA